MPDTIQLGKDQMVVSARRPNRLLIFKGLDCWNTMSRLQRSHTHMTTCTCLSARQVVAVLEFSQQLKVCSVMCEVHL